MQRLIGVVVNDATLLGALAERYAGAFDLGSLGGRGFWGLGFRGNGELLIKRSPLTAATEAVAALGDVRARHVVLAADGAPTSRRLLEDAQPLRYRDWLFAASGTDALDDAFVAAARGASRLSSFGSRPGVTPDEALMLVFMDALYAGHVRDTRKLEPVTLAAAVVAGVARVRELAGDAADALAVCLCGHEHLYATSLGRPLHRAVVTGEGWAREARSASARQQAHLRGVIISDAPGADGLAWEPLADGVVVGPDASPVALAQA